MKKISSFIYLTHQKYPAIQMTAMLHMQQTSPASVVSPQDELLPKLMWD